MVRTRLAAVAAQDDSVMTEEDFADLARREIAVLEGQRAALQAQAGALLRQIRCMEKRRQGLLAYLSADVPPQAAHGGKRQRRSQLAHHLSVLLARYPAGLTLHEMRAKLQLEMQVEVPYGTVTSALYRDKLRFRIIRRGVFALADTAQQEAPHA